MTPKEQAARQALSTDEALMALELILRDGIEHGNWPLNKNCEDGLEAITALREALAEQADMNLNCKSVQARLAASWGYVKAEQAEQEPVAWAPIITFRDAQHYLVSKQKTPEYCNPLYAAPVLTKDLTDVDLWNLWEKSDSNIEFARAVIAADREKNK